MRIIFITREGYDLSGARVRCYNFARALRKYGMDTEVFSFADNLGAKYGEKEFQMSFSEKLRYNMRALKILLRKEKDSIFFIQRFNYHAMAPCLASLFRKNRIIFDCDDWNIREDPVYYFGFFPSSKMEFLTRWIAGKADICIAASSFLKDYLAGFNKNVYFIPTGVDTDMFKPGPVHNGNSRVTLSWIGTLYHKEMKENVEFILDCFSTLADRYGNVFLSLAGEGKYYKEIFSHAGSLKHRNRIMMNGWIEPDMIPDYLSGVDIGLLPLTQDTKFNKAKSPTKLFEYMAMARPVVSSNTGEAGRVIADGRNGFLAGTRAEFIEKLERLVNNPLLRKNTGCNARQDVEKKYSLNVIGGELYRLLKTI